MNETIKHRIEQICRGEVPKGYKKTKVGIVPEEWEEIRFNKKFSRVNRKNTEGNTNVLTISAQYGLINQEEFFNKSVASEDKSTYFLLKKGEYAYNKSYSSGYPFGALKRLERYDSGVVSPLYICFAATSENKCPDFYSQYFEAGKMNSEIQAFAQEGARNHGLLNISVDDFFNSVIVSPSLAEQEKIAEILATQDKVIELKEKLLEEKKNQKKYLMQQLLTGKKRLAGFNTKWVEERIGKYLAESAIVTTPNINKRITVKLHLGGICHREIKAIEKEDATIQYLRKAGQFIYGKQNFHNGAFGIIPSELDGFQSSSDLPSFDISNQINKTWFFYYCSMSDFYRKLEITSTGTGSKRTRPDTFLDIKISFPSKEEQKSIAELLSNADREILLIQNSIDEEKQKKKALMQLLLTGIVRV